MAGNGHAGTAAVRPGHHHAIDSHPPDCASCFAGSVPPADQALAPPALVLLRLACSHFIFPAAQPASPVLRSFLIPHAHGPPGPVSLS